MNIDDVPTLAEHIISTYSPSALDPGVTQPTIVTTPDGFRALTLPHDQMDEPARSLHLLHAVALGHLLVVTFRWTDGDDGTIFVMQLDTREVDLDLADTVAVTTFLTQHIEFTLGGPRESWEAARSTPSRSSHWRSYGPGAPADIPGTEDSVCAICRGGGAPPAALSARSDGGGRTFASTQIPSTRSPRPDSISAVGHIEAMAVGHVLPDGRELFAGVSFRVGDGAKVALVGPNGAGKTTLLRMIAGELTPVAGSIARSGGLGVMGQFIGSIADDRTLADLALSLAPLPVRAAGERLRQAEGFLDDGERSQLRYAEALAAWGEAGGYAAEVEFDTAAVAALDLPWDRARFRPVATLSGGEQKRFALELLLRGQAEVLLLDEPDNFLDVPSKRWLEERIGASGKSVLFVSHDRELLANTAQRVVTVEAGSAWVHPGGFASWHAARVARHDRLDEQRRRWDEERAKLERLVAYYKAKATHNDGMASRLQAARTRLARFVDAGPPQEKAREQSIKMRLGGGRTGKRAVVCEQLELDGLTYPFDLEVWFGDRVAVLGANGSGKSHFLRLLARGGTDPEPATVPASGAALSPVRHDGAARLGARVRPGHFSQTHDRPELTGTTCADLLVRGDVDRAGMPLGAAMKALSRYELTQQAEQRFETLSGGQQARLLILLLELSGATLLLLDEPTDNLDLASAEALEQALAAFDGTVLAVTHDRWFTRGFDRFVLFGVDGEVRETDQPVWETH